MTYGHGGHLRDLARKAGVPTGQVLDFSANINPLGPPPCLAGALSRSVEALVHYPDPDAAELVQAIAKRYALVAESIVVGNGSTEILFALVRALKPARAIIPVPSYIDYANACRQAGVEVRPLPLREQDGFALDLEALALELRGGELVFLGRPNNPTGLIFDRAEFLASAQAHPTTMFVVDEAFADFVEGAATLASEGVPNVIVLRSLTKFYAIPGLRLGFAAATPEVARRICEEIPHWSVSVPAQQVGAAMLADEDYARRTIEFVKARRAELAAELGKLPGLCVYRGEANFLLVRIDRADMDADLLAERLIAQGIAIRTFLAGQHLDGRFFRVAVRTEQENARLVAAIDEALNTCRQVAHDTRGQGVLATKHAAAIMLQGTSSNAGKSVLAAALCRILLQDGLRVAPFKSQNMSLNSFVTADGGEMGRAQVVQAQACRLDPDVRMNPILLKPNSDTGCQVIVRGKPVGNMRVGEYIKYKPQAFAAACECYDSLAEQYDVVVLEGAGSPGEVNLKRHDIVNMRMAQYASAPVLVVGDIDRGGVFASFVGTLEVLEPWERSLLAGWVVNRFRGDVRLLDDALTYTLDRTGKPVLGVVPYLPALNIPQEDSVEFKSGAMDRAKPAAAVEVAVIDLPHISNFTDFDALGLEDDVRVRIIRPRDDLGSPDAIILPGSKNTLGDLAYLRKSGLAVRIMQLAKAGQAQVVGICGGFQILGTAIHDPHEIESSGEKTPGLGLLAVQTVMAAEKTLTRVTARHERSGLEVQGYEIHHGVTEREDARAGASGNGSRGAFCTSDGRSVGETSADGRVWGTYLHGVFDADQFRRHWIDSLRVAKGLPALGKLQVCYDVEPALERLAAAVRKSLKMDEIYRLLRL